MLAGGLDAVYRRALYRPHHPYVRVEVWAQGVRIDTYGSAGVPIIGGTVTATLASRVARQVSMQVSGTLWEQGIDGLLDPYGNELRIFRGITGTSLPNFEFQVFRGKITDAPLNDDGVVSISAADRAAEIAGANFMLPESSQAGDPILIEFQRLITDALPDATFGLSSPISNVTPVLTWENDRSAACDDLANASGAFWYPEADGDFIMRTVPWTIAQTPILRLCDGLANDGDPLIIDWNIGKTRMGVFNQVTVVGERADGTLPVYATARDEDVTSPTYINGKFGVQSQLVNNQAVTTQGQALALANRYLARWKALTETWSVTMIADPSIELGDCLFLSVVDQELQRIFSSTQVVSSFTMPLTVSDSMDVQFRALTPGLEAPDA